MILSDLDLAPPAPDALPHMRVPPPGPLSRQWLARLRAVESPNVTSIVPEFPVVWHSARGAAVRDVDGNTYLDATSAFGVALIGHSHPRVVAAANRQAQLLVHGMGDVHPSTVRIELLEALTRIAPGDLGHGVLCTGGSEAVEVALKTALLATGKAGVVAFAGSYHGLGHGALDATSRRDFRAPFAAQLARNTTWVPFPHPGRPPVGVTPTALLDHVLSRVDEAIAHPAMGGVPIGAVLVEPIQGRGGSIVPPHGFLRRLRELCDRHGILLILDEIFTGCGRTGHWFACEAEDVVPDLLCIGKALGGGYPVSACLGRPHVMAAWGESTGEALHTSTFLGHPVAAAAALETLAVLRDEDVPGRAQALGADLRARLAARLAGQPFVAEVRGRGVMIGVEFRDPATGAPAPRKAWSSVVHALKSGLLLLPAGIHGEVVQVTPPAVLTPAQMDALVEGLGRAVEQAEG
jgi:4-aminobutyrate aminotransferase-like enzyme